MSDVRSPRARSALLLIDMQKEGKYGIEGMDRAIANAVPLVEACRAAGVPVLYTRQLNRADAIGLPNADPVGSDGAPIFYRSDSASVDVIAEVAPRPGEIVIDKHRWSGFHQTSLDLVLRSLGVRNLMIGGFVTDGCVMTTVFDAYARDYQVTLAVDISAATNEGSHRAAVVMMANWVYDIEIVSSEQAIRMVNGNEYRRWRSTAPDQVPFTASTLDSAYSSIIVAGE